MITASATTSSRVIRRAMSAFERELANAGVDRVALDLEEAHRDRQLETARSGAAGIDEQHAIAARNLWLVRVPRDDSGKARGCRIEIELGNIVQHVDVPAAKLDAFELSDARGPRTLVVV